MYYVQYRAIKNATIQKPIYTWMETGVRKPLDTCMNQILVCSPTLFQLFSSTFRFLNIALPAPNVEFG